MLQAGEKAEKGTYKCTQCGYILEHEGGELPICPQCGNDTWDKVD